MRDNEKVFAYILISTDFNAELESDLADYYWGGIIEAFMDCEEQWIEPAALWPFGWGTNMSRISVVQIVKEHNPCQWVLKLIEDQLIQPCFLKEDDDGIIIVFQKDKVNLDALDIYHSVNKFFARFVQLLRLSVSNSTGYKDLVFLGGRGFSGDLEIEASEQQLLRQVGVQIPSRMPT